MRLCIAERIENRSSRPRRPSLLPACMHNTRLGLGEQPLMTDGSKRFYSLSHSNYDRKLNLICFLGLFGHGHNHGHSHGHGLKLCSKHKVAIYSYSQGKFSIMGVSVFWTQSFFRQKISDLRPSFFCSLILAFFFPRSGLLSKLS